MSELFQNERDLLLPLPTDVEIVDGRELIRTEMERDGE